MKQLKLLLISGILSAPAFGSTCKVLSAMPEVEANTSQNSTVQSSFAQEAAKIMANKKLVIRFAKKDYSSWENLEDDAKILQAAGYQSDVTARFTNELIECLRNNTQGELSYWEEYMSKDAILNAVETVFRESPEAQTVANLLQIVTAVYGKSQGTTETSAFSLLMEIKAHKSSLEQERQITEVEQRIKLGYVDDETERQLKAIILQYGSDERISNLLQKIQEGRESIRLVQNLL